MSSVAGKPSLGQALCVFVCVFLTQNTQKACPRLGLPAIELFEQAVMSSTLTMCQNLPFSYYLETGAYLCCKWVPYFCDNHVDGQSKTNIFASNYLECKTQSDCFDEKHANFRVKHKFLNFSAPYCRESKIQHPTCRVVGIPKYAPVWKQSWITHNQIDICQPVDQSDLTWLS